MPMLDISAVDFSVSSTALTVTLSPESVGILSALLLLAIERDYLWASNGDPLSDVERASLTDALDTAWAELRTDDNP